MNSEHFSEIYSGLWYNSKDPDPGGGGAINKKNDK